MKAKADITIGNCRLILGDMREVLPNLGECADLVCTDPPYTLTSGGCPPSTGQRMSGKFNNDKYNNDGNIVECNIDWSEFMPLLYKALRGDSHAYVMSNNRHVGNMLNSAAAAGFRFHNLLVWDKGTATPNRWYMKNCEYTGFFYKGAAKYINDCGARQLLYVPQEPYGEHPTPKPVKLMRHYIEQSTTAGETVLDPFMGSGAAAAACVLSGRRFVGIEYEQRWFDVACARVTEALEVGGDTLDMFASVGGQP